MQDGYTSREAAIAEVRRILRGIDLEECESDDGWWETSMGAERGARALGEIEALIVSLVA